MPSKGRARRERRLRNGSLQSNKNPSKLVHQPCTTTSPLGAWGKGSPQTGSNFEEYTSGYSNSACSSVAKGAWVKGCPFEVKTDFTNPLLTDSENTSDDDGFVRFYRQNLTNQQLQVFETELAKTGNIPHAIMTVRGDYKLGEGPGNLGRGEGPKYTTLSNGFANPNSSEMILLFGRPD
tara:strand:- start:470 stop:1006 length:537 start_codon:yes stop_codon:yes gene_type:complete